MGSIILIFPKKENHLHKYLIKTHISLKKVDKLLIICKKALRAEDLHIISLKKAISALMSQKYYKETTQN